MCAHLTLRPACTSAQSSMGALCVAKGRTFLQVENQGSYRQDCVKFKDFSRTFKTLLLFPKTEHVSKILISSEMLESINKDINLKKLV